MFLLVPKPIFIPLFVAIFRLQCRQSLGLKKFRKFADRGIGEIEIARAGRWHVREGSRIHQILPRAAGNRRVPWRLSERGLHEHDESLLSNPCEASVGAVDFRATPSRMPPHFLRAADNPHLRLRGVAALTDRNADLPDAAMMNNQ